MLEIGSVLKDRYKILKQIGAGGVSRVYLAMDEKMNKQVAVKAICFKDCLNTGTYINNYKREIDKVKRLDSPAIHKIYDVIENDNSIIVVMDYMQGKDLAQILKEQGPQPEEKVIEWGKQLCDALDYLHSQNLPLLYLNLKPSEIWLKPDGQIMLINVEYYAREYKESNIESTGYLGTIGYTTPEEFIGEGHVDLRADIYSLGATLHHLVTGHSPAEPPYEIYPIRCFNPALSGGLEWIIDKCCQPIREDRFQSCAEVLYALEHIDESGCSVVYGAPSRSILKKFKNAMEVRKTKKQIKHLIEIKYPNSHKNDN